MKKLKMQRRFKLIVTFLIGFTTTMSLLAQDAVKFKDVLLDGKPAKLNMVTGEITPVKLKEQIIENQVDSLITKPIMVTNSQSVADSSEPEILEDTDSDFYMVKEGDNLFKISVKFKTSLALLQKGNNLETTLIKKGQILRVRNFNKVTSDVSVWIVVKGDNLYRIAIKTGTTVSEIKRLNGLANDTIYIGQELQLK